MSPSHLAQTGVLDLIFDAGIVAKFVLLMLFGASIFCWAIIFTKWRAFKVALKENEKFLGIFRSGKNVDEIVSRSEKFSLCPIAAVFKHGVRELQKFSTADGAPFPGNEKIDNVNRALFRASSEQIASLEKHLGWLATTASAAPFVGLFGTVWGIMNSFIALGGVQQATLAMVAPGIAEALVATAMGLVAAIPAMVAYNRFTHQIVRLTSQYENFCEELTGILQRKALDN